MFNEYAYRHALGRIDSNLVKFVLALRNLTSSHEVQ